MASYEISKGNEVVGIFSDDDSGLSSFAEAKALRKLGFDAAYDYGLGRIVVRGAERPRLTVRELRRNPVEQVDPNPNTDIY